MAGEPRAALRLGRLNLISITRVMAREVAAIVAGSGAWLGLFILSAAKTPSHLRLL